MTEYTVHLETALTVPPNPADGMGIYSTLASRTRSVTSTLLSMSPVTVTAATSATTGTNILPYGITTITSSNNALGYILSPPTYAGFKVTVTMLTTGGATVTSSSAVMITQASTANVTATFNGVKGAVLRLEALSTASWLNVTSTTTANIAWS